MAATARDSTLYTNYVTNKYIPDPRDRFGTIQRVHFGATIVSASNIADTYSLFVIPNGYKVSALMATTNGLGASAGAGCTAQIGDSGDDDRLMAATDFDATNAQGVLRYEGHNYRPTADTIELLKIGTAAAVVGKIFIGFVDLIPPS